MVRDGRLGSDHVRRRRARLRLGRHAAGAARATSRPPGAPIRTSPGSPAWWVTSAPTPSTCCATSPGWTPTAVRAAAHPGARSARLRPRHRGTAADRRGAGPALGQHGRHRPQPRPAHPRLRRQGSLEWEHEDPHHLRVQDLDGDHHDPDRGLGTLSEDAARLTRVGLGHPEGFLEAFANFYRDLADELRARRDGTLPPTRELSFPTGRTASSASGSSKPSRPPTTRMPPGSRPAPAVRTSRKQESDMQRFALLGAGFIGSVHAANLAAHPGVDFALVYDVDHDRATGAGRRPRRPGRHRPGRGVRPLGRRRRLHRLLHRHPCRSTCAARPTPAWRCCARSRSTWTCDRARETAALRRRARRSR